MRQTIVFFPRSNQFVASYLSKTILVLFIRIGKPMNLIQTDSSRKASNKGEEGEEGDEKKLEAISRKSEGVGRQFNIITRSFGYDSRSGRPSQESRNSSLLLTFEDGKTIIVDGFLGLRGLAGLGGFLVVEGRRRIGVDGRVDEDRCDNSVGTSSVDLSELEVLCLFSERRVSLAGRWGALLRIDRENRSDLKKKIGNSM